MEHCFTSDPILNHITYDANQKIFSFYPFLAIILYPFQLIENKLFWWKTNHSRNEIFQLHNGWAPVYQNLIKIIFLHFNKFPISQIETMWAQAPTLWRIVTASHYYLVLTLIAYLDPPTITFISGQTLGLYHKIYNFSYFWTNLRPKSVELIFVHILRPQSSEARLFEFWTKIFIIGLTITLY